MADRDAERSLRAGWRLGWTSPRVAGRPWAVVSLAALLLAGTGCERAEPDAGGAAVGPIGASGLNVLLISLDTIRADHLGCYGHPVIQTPNIDRLAAEGTRFTQCVSSAPCTLPSHATMMTGSRPFVHGARDNSTYFLADENETLTEIFQQAGYATCAAIATVVLEPRFGLDQGFDSYDSLELPSDVMPENWNRPRSAGRPGDFPTGDRWFDQGPFGKLERTADDITRRGIKLLEGSADKPFFIFLHYYDPHYPYQAPERFSGRYADPYVAEIAYVDEQFGRVMDALGRLGLADKTLVVLTSDHGEGRGQHGEGTHSFFLYDTTVHVPLIIWCPGRVPGGQVVESQVRLLDLAPTILDFVGLKGGAQVQGTTLLPLLAHPSRDLHLACYADSIAPKVNFGYSVLRSIRADGWKYILSADPELYYVAEDPGELFNVVGAETERAAAMREQLRGLIAQSPPPPASRGSRHMPNAAERQMLEALGYLAGGTGPRSEDPTSGGSELDDFEPSGPNPRDKIQVIELLCMATGFLRYGEYEKAERAYRQLVELEPTRSVLVRELADSLVGLGRHKEAIELYARAVELDPEDYMAHTDLASLLAREGNFADAERGYRRAIELEPAKTLGRFGLANVLTELGRYGEAMEEYAAAVALVPDDPDFLLKWGQAAVLAGKPGEAIRHLQRALEVKPDSGRALLELGRALEATNRPAAALETYRRAAEVAPEEVGAYLAVARLLAQSGDLRGGIEFLRWAHSCLPEDVAVMNELAWRLATCPDDALRDDREAVALAEQANQATGGQSPEVLDTLAAAYAEAGRFDQAVATADQASRIAGQAGAQELASRVETRKNLYERHQPYRDR